MTAPAAPRSSPAPRSLAGTERKTAVRAAVLGAVVAAVVILANSRGNVTKMTLSDGLISRYIAANLNQDSEDVDRVVAERGTSLRYGRIGLSALIWLMSAGRAPAMPYLQPLVMVLSAGAVTAAVALLLERAPPYSVLVPFLALGFTLAVAGGYQDAPAMALGIWAVAVAARERWWPAAGLLAAAMLMRENAGAVLIGLIVWCLTGRRVRQTAILATSLVPVIAWHAYVASRYGHWPLLDPYLRVKTSTIRPPFLAVWQSLTRSPAEAAVLAVIHVVLAAAAFSLWRRGMIGAVAAAAGLQVIMAGPFAYRFGGEAVRAFAPLQLFLVLTIFTIVNGRNSSVSVTE